MRCFVVAFATASLVMAVAARTASATGPCENTEVHYDPPELFDDATQSFAIPATQPWCDASFGAVVEEIRGVVKYVELRDVHGTVLGILSTATGTDADHLRQRVTTFEAIPYGKLHATLLKRGYAPIAGGPKSCKLATAWTDVAAAGGWRGATLQLDVARGSGATARATRVPLGRGSIERRGDQIVRAHVIRNKAIAVFATVPSCAGPPPGYFGPDDGGDCYHVDTPTTLLLEGAVVDGCFDR